MRILRTLAVCALLPACGGGDGPSAAATAAESLAGVAHRDAKYVASYGGARFLVDVTFVDMLDKSVIVVREDGPTTSDREDVALSETVPVSGAMPWSAERQGGVAVSIAEQLAPRLTVCPGPSMRLDTLTDGTPRHMYRGEKRAWVIFAACPAGEG